MMLRWYVERIETDYFAYNKDPVLQVYVSGDWLDIPTEIVVNDKRTKETDVSTSVQMSLPQMPAYPYTTPHLD